MEERKENVKEGREKEARAGQTSDTLSLCRFAFASSSTIGNTVILNLQGCHQVNSQQGLLMDAQIRQVSFLHPWFIEISRNSPLH